MTAQQKNVRKLIVLGVLTLIAVLAFLTIDVNFSNPKFFRFSMELRVPKLLAMLLAAFAIGAASIVFQSVINNTIVTPCLLGMNALYTLIHTLVYFAFGSASLLARNANLSFAVDLVVMGVAATFIYGYLFKKTNYNVLYVLLIGTVLSSFFGSIQSTMVRVMDPNEYEELLMNLVASFDNVQSEIILANLARQMMKTYRHTHLMLASAMIGMIVLVAGQCLVEHVFAYAVPVSVFITIGGGVYFLFLLLRQKR